MKYNKKEIREFNLKIAEFMNAKVVNTYLYFNEVSYLLYYEKNTSPEMCKHIACSALKYHSSWDWLMPVVDKIEDLGFWTKIYGNTSFGKQYKQCCIKKHHKDSDAGYVYEYEGDWCESKIEAVYKAVIEFIAWLTRNKQDNCNT